MLESEKLQKRILKYLRRRDYRLVTLKYIHKTLQEHYDPTLKYGAVVKALQELKAYGLVGVSPVLSSDGYKAYRATYQDSELSEREVYLLQTTE